VICTWSPEPRSTCTSPFMLRIVIHRPLGTVPDQLNVSERDDCAAAGAAAARTSAIAASLDGRSMVGVIIGCRGGPRRGR
jgi:hypothetical protein